MVLAKSSRDIDQVHAISNYEFTLTPRALLAPDGSTLPCTDKSKLIHALEKLTQELPISDPKTLPDATGMQDETVSSQVEDSCYCRKIAVVDGMVVVQKLIKPTTVHTVKDLSECFNYKLMSLTREYDEVILVFDTYKFNSLKNATREKRRHGKDPIQKR